MSQQVVIDSLVFSSQGKSLTGQIPVSQFVRLRDQLERMDRSLDFRIAGSTGEQGEALLLLQVSGTLPLRCQRCLKALDYGLAVEQLFELRSGPELDALTQDELEDDSRDFLPASRSLDVAALIEDEVLLALPVVARHESCELPDQARNPEAASPFGVLLGLKGQSGKTH